MVLPNKQGTMTNNEKAIELVSFYREYIRMADKYGHLLGDDEIHLAKQCAIKLCDERAKLIVELSERGYWLDKIQEQIDIKKEIEKL